MKMTIKDNPAAIRRYAHIRPAPALGSRRCSVECPGTRYTCTLEKGHTGVHVAHGRFRRVVAVWDREARIREAKRVAKGEKKAVTRPSRPGLVARVRGIWGRVVPSAHTIEAVFLVAAFVGMLAWAIDVALKIFGSF